MRSGCCRAWVLVLAVVSIMVGLREPMVTAQAGVAPATVTIRRNNTLNGAVWPGDFNGDGIADLAGNDPFTSSGPLALVVLGKGDGTFGTPIRTQCACSVLDVGDFDNDGRADLLVEPSSGPVLVLPGNGNGTFGTGRPVTQAASRLRAGFVADLDGDRTIDVVLLAGDEFDGQVMVVPGNGDLTFRPATILTAPTIPYGGAAADLDGDGKKDIVVANHDGHSISIFLNQGSFTFAAADMPLDRQANAVVSGDLNLDGKMDLIVATSSDAGDDFFYTDGYAYVLIGNGNGTFAEVSEKSGITKTNGTYGLAVLVAARPAQMPAGTRVPARCLRSRRRWPTDPHAAEIGRRPAPAAGHLRWR